MIKLVHFSFRTEETVNEVCGFLNYHSVYYVVEPLPDDIWRVSVKPEMRARLIAFIKEQLVGQALVAAEAHSDDHVTKAEFNAAWWLMTATDKEVLELAKCGWGCDYPADAVAKFMRHFDYNLERMFAHIKNLIGTKDAPGFEVQIDAGTAVRFLIYYRPELFEKLIAGKKEDVDGNSVQDVRHGEGPEG
jgi:hypothetical protein